MNMSKQKLEEMYFYLLLTRRLEEKIAFIYRNEPGAIPGNAWLSRGQEAISVGAAFAIRDGDWVAPSHRDMGLYLVRGITPRQIFSQYFGRIDGPTRGRDGSVHLGALDKGILFFISHMGAMLPPALGVARSFLYKEQKHVVLAFFGEGASSQGSVHESMNYAGVMKLPMIFICNNNRYALSTPFRLQTAVEDLAIRAQGYGFPGQVVDGNDILTVYEAVNKAVDRARKGKGPTLIECKTMRMSGHAEHDPADYVPREELEEWRKKDPIDRFRNHLVNVGVIDDAKLQRIEAQIAEIIEDAVAFARQSPLPSGEEVLKGVFKNEGEVA